MADVLLPGPRGTHKRLKDMGDGTHAEVFTVGSTDGSQTVILLNTLYQIERNLTGYEQPAIEVIGGTVDIYGSQKTPTSAPTGMFKTVTGFAGIDSFGIVPNYLYVTQSTGSTTSIILTGVSVKAV